MPGPVPKHTSQRRRRNTDGGPVTSAPGAAEVTAPVADPNWHPLALQWYEALKASGQAQFYQPSDWATAMYVAEAMSINLRQGKFSAVLFASVMSAASNLLVTEGDRRRLRLELTAAEKEDPDLANAHYDLTRQYRDLTGH